MENITNDKPFDLGEITRQREEEQLDGDILIIETMGGVFEVIPLLGEGYRLPKQIQNKYFNHSYNAPSWFPTDAFAFHEDWNLLMSACKYIRNEIKKPSEGQAEHLYNLLFDSIIYDFDVTMTFLFVIGFLKEIKQ